MEACDFSFGEKKNVSIEVFTRDRRQFEITDATFNLYSGEDIEISGECSVDKVTTGDYILNALIHPNIPNNLYILEYIYSVYPETFKYYVNVRVGGACNRV